jgi:hypothetical protein
MKPLLRIAVAAVACGIAFGAAAMTRAEYSAQRARVQDKYATEKDRCSTRAPQQRELCEVQARVDYDTARLALRAQFRPSARNVEKARRAQADAHYAVERTRCGDLRGSAQKVCLDEARSTWAAAQDDERLFR